MKSEFLDLLRDIRILVAASAQASHLTDGFKIGADGEPRSNRRESDEDRLLQRVDAAISSLDLAALRSSRSVREEKKEEIMRATSQPQPSNSGPDPRVDDRGCAHVVGGHPGYWRFGQRCTRRGVVEIGGLWFCQPHAKHAAEVVQGP